MPSIAQLEKLLSIDPEDPFVYYGIGQEHAKLDAHELAIEYFDKTLELDAHYCYAYYFKAISLKELGRQVEAVEVAKHGHEIATSISDGKARSELSSLIQSL